MQSLSFPKPVDIPRPHPGILEMSPKKKGFSKPPFAESVAKEAPAISMISPDTRPDETLAIAGHNLKGAHLMAWQEGKVKRIDPFQGDSNKMLAILPKNYSAGTTLLWPVRGKTVGRPIRLNAASAWWSWPCRTSLGRVRAGERVRLFGQSLEVKGGTPCLVLESGEKITPLKITESSPYELQATLPKDLQPGVYRLWAHNGSGGELGWSEATHMEVVLEPCAAQLPVFKVDDYGAKPDSGLDASPAIQKAIHEAKLHGGSIIRFSRGVYSISRTIKTPINVNGGLHFEGVGMGRFKPGLAGPAGKCTVLRPMEGRGVPSHLMEIIPARCTLRHLAFYSLSTGRHQECLRIHGKDCVMEKCLIVLMDGRPRHIPPKKRKDLHIGGGALFVDAPGKSNIRILGCHFHSAASGIKIGREARDGTKAQEVDLVRQGEPFGPSTGQVIPEEGTHFVQVRDCVFRGYWTGLYKEPVKNKKFFYGATGIFQSGILFLNGDAGIVEHCDFSGADKKKGLCINRSILYYRSTMKNQFCAHNKSYNVGLVKPKESPRGINQGEQIMFHLRYPSGGYFDVTGAQDQSVTLRTDDPRAQAPEKRPYIMQVGRKGSIIPEEVGQTPGWYAYVARGKGVGQYREILHVERTKEEATLHLDKPWRVNPNGNSNVVVTAAFRHNIVYDNVVDAGVVDMEIKVLGTIFWFDAFENVITGNTYKNLSGGALFNTSFRHPVCWNQTRENVMENIFGYSADTSQVPAFYTDNYRCFAFDKDDPRLLPSGEEAGWYSIGNMVRHNQGKQAVAAAMVHARLPGTAIKPEPDEYYSRLEAAPDSGMMMHVIEHNDFQETEHGIVVSPPANWTVIRKNHLRLNDEKNLEVFDQTKGNCHSIWKIE